MNPFDRWVIALGTPLFAAGLLWGTVSADETHGPGVKRGKGGDPIPNPAALDPAPSTSAPIDMSANPLASLKITAEEGTTLVSFDLLKSYEYQEGLAGMTPEIQALDGKRVTMVGFLLPLYEFEDIHEFALVGNHWSCCFGQPPTLSGVVTVKLDENKPGLPNTSNPIRVVGTFRVKELKESGYIISIYSIDASNVQVLRY